MTNDPAVLFVKPGAISNRDKKALQTAGVIIVEIEDPTSVKFVRAAADLSSGELLAAAGKAINFSSSAQSAFGAAVATFLEAKKP